MKIYLIVPLLLLGWGVGFCQTISAPVQVDTDKVNTMVARNGDQMFIFESFDYNDGSLILRYEIPYPCQMTVTQFDFIVNGTALSPDKVNMGFYLTVVYTDMFTVRHIDKILYTSTNGWKILVNGKEKEIVCPEIQ